MTTTTAVLELTIVTTILWFISAAQIATDVSITAMIVVGFSYALTVMIRG
jgi:hypothetical protein